MNKQTRIYVAGHKGMVGSAIVRELSQQGYNNLIVADIEKLDLRNQSSTEAFMEKEQPDVVIIAAAVVGGILANSQHPWKFLYDNLMIEANLIKSAHEQNVQHLIFLGSSCIYPKLAPQPLKEEYLLTASIEPTNEWYAIAKIAGIKLCQALNKQYGRKYISLMPTNLYGPHDNFDLETSHVLPAMIRKFHEAKVNSHAPVTIWGTGSPRREFLHVHDLASAIRFIMEYDKPISYDLINVGTGKDLRIKELAETIQMITGHKGTIEWDADKPDGTPRKLMDTTRINKLGWQPLIVLENGIEDTYRWYLKEKEN
jgi:GDP-L-fucose synthase